MPTDRGIRSFFTRLVLAGLAMPVPMEEALDAAVALWREALADVADEQLVVAATRLITRPRDGNGHRFWPQPADVREMLGLGELLNPGRPSRTMDPDSAWGQILQLASLKGRDNPPQFGNAPPEGEPAFEEIVVNGVKKMKRIRRPGALRWRLSDDPAVCAAMEAGVLAVGGWAVVCGDTDQLVHGFRRAYQAEWRRGEARIGELVSQIEARRPAPLSVISGGRE